MKLQLADNGRYTMLSEPISATIAAITAAKKFIDSPIGKQLWSAVEAWLGRVFPQAERDRLNAIIDELYLNAVSQFRDSTGQSINYKGGITAEFAAFTTYLMINLLNKLNSEPVPATDGGKRLKARYIQAAKDIMVQMQSRMEEWVRQNPPAPVAPPVAPPVYIKPAPIAPLPPAPPVPPAPAPALPVSNIGLALIGAKLLGIF